MPTEESMLARETWARYAYLRDTGHLDYVKKAKKCDDFFEGLQWDKNDLALLKEFKRPSLTINKIISTVANVMGEQIFNRTDIAFKPRNEGATEEIATALTKVFMQIGDNNQLAWVRSDVFADGIIGSRGFFDARLDFTDSLRGEVRVEQLNPRNVLIDGDADEYDADKWADVFITKWLSNDQLELLYGKKNADKVRNNSNAFFPYGYDAIDNARDRFGMAKSGFAYSGGEADDFSNIVRNNRVLERQHRKLDRQDHLVDLKTGDTRPVPASWGEEQVEQHLANNPQLTVTKKLVQRIRWTVVCGDYVLHDDWSPYKHFTVVPYFPFFRRGRTMGLVENLLGPQELLNKVSSQELHILNTTANSGWITKKGNVKNMTMAELQSRGAQSGLVLEVDDLTQIEKIVPNSTPTGLDRISYKAEEHIKSISGVSDYMQGNPREDVSAKAVNSNKQSGQANLAKVMDNMNRTDHMLARNILDLVQEFYTEERLLHITTDRLTNTTEQMQVNQITPEGQILNDLTIGEYGVVVTNQPERDTFEETQFQQAVSLKTEAGVAIPDKFIIMASRLKDKAEIVRTIEGDKDSPKAKAQAALLQRKSEAEVATMEAEAQQKGTDARLKSAKAQKELASIGKNSDENEMSIELQKLDLERQIEREKLDMQREKMEGEFALKREELQMEMRLRQEKHAQDQEIKRAAAVADIDMKKKQGDAAIMQSRVAAVEKAKADNAKAKPKAGAAGAEKPAPTTA